MLRNLLFIHEWWKNEGINTNNMNTTLMNIILKQGKQHDVMKGLRPTQMAHPIFKIYAFKVLRRAERCESELKLTSNEQYAAKKGCGSEDCLIAMMQDWNTIKHEDQSTALVTFDSGDAFNSMQPQIIHDELMHHMGFDMKAITMFKSLEYNVIVRLIMFIHSQCQSDPVHFTRIHILIIWCIYVNPLIMKIKQTQVILGDKERIMARVCIKALMDDITIYTKIYFWYHKPDERCAYQKIIDKMVGKTSASQIIPVQIQKQLVQMFQNCINMVNDYLSMINVPINRNKTQLMIIKSASPNNNIGRNSNNDQQQYQSTKYIADAECHLHGENMRKRTWIKLLRIKVDEKLEFNKQIDTCIQTMSNIRIRCYRIINNNIQFIKMDIIRKMVESLSMVHLNHAGCVILTLAKNINPLKQEYNKTMKIMTGKLWNINQIANAMFKGSDI